MDKENDEKPEEEQLDEDELHEQCSELFKETPRDTAASTNPEYKWVIMRGAFVSFATAMRERGYRSPDAFGMYIYNDFEGYGILEMVENHIQKFATEYAKKNRELKDMWIPLVSLAHFLRTADTEVFNMLEDGARVTSILMVIGRAYLSMLNALDRAGQLGPDSEFKDLGLVTALYLIIPGCFEDAYDNDEDGEFDWREILRHYVQAKKIDVSHLFGGEEVTLNDDDTPLEEYEGIPKPGEERWKFKDALKEYKSGYTSGRKIGGENFNIMKMARGERARYAFNKKDPLKDFSDKDIREGKLRVG